MKLRITAAKVDRAGSLWKFSVTDRGKILNLRSKFLKKLQVVLVIEAESFISSDRNHCFHDTSIRLSYSFRQLHFDFFRSPGFCNNTIQIDPRTNLLLD